MNNQNVIMKQVVIFMKIAIMSFMQLTFSKKEFFSMIFAANAHYYNQVSLSYALISRIVFFFVFFSLGNHDVFDETACPSEAISWPCN